MLPASSPLIKENCYIYSIWTGRLKVYEGSVYRRYDDESSASFKTKTKRYLCSSQPGTVYNGTLWLPEMNLAEATRILIEHEELRIATLEEQIANHIEKIKLLKGE